MRPFPMSGISPASTILARAQEAVDRWTPATQPDFARAMEVAVWMYWSPTPANAAEREAFLQVAAAIHRGDGDVVTYPALLLRIARAALDGGAAPAERGAAP